jgi:hypothetical protein
MPLADEPLLRLMVIHFLLQNLEQELHWSVFGHGSQDFKPRIIIALTKARRLNWEHWDNARGKSV